MNIGKRSALPILAAACWGMAATTYAQDSAKISSPQECLAIMKRLPRAKNVTEYKPLALNLEEKTLTGVRPTSSGITIKRTNQPDMVFAYKQMQSAEVRHPYGECCLIVITMADNKQWGFDFVESLADVGGTMAEAISKRLEAESGELANSLNQIINNAHQGHPACADVWKGELDAFAQKTAAWRALATKPPLSEEVNKKRLLAEDAAQRNFLTVAVDEYEAGVKADPTWAQGWYNAASIYAQMKNYSLAAYCMKHYLILMPDAADAQAVRDKVKFWDAQAAESKT